MKQPLVSVIVPVHNGERFLRESIGSALAQGYPEFEIVVTDDGSTDASPAILRELSADIRVIHQPRQGAAAARNAAIAAARGDLLAFLDCDDRWDANKIERQVLLHQRFPEAVASYCDHRIIDAEGRVTGTTGALAYPRWSGRILRELVQGNCIVSPSVLMARREAVLAAGGFDPTQPAGSDDWQLSMHLAALGPILYLPETLASYRRHDGNTSAAWSHRKSLGDLHALQSIAARVEASDEPRLREIYRSALYKAHLSAGWRHRQAGERGTALRNYLQALRLQPWNLPLALRIILLSVAPPSLMRTRTGP